MVYNAGMGLMKSIAVERYWNPSLAWRGETSESTLAAMRETVRRLDAEREEANEDAEVDALIDEEWPWELES
jgi:hypothetical protein